MLLADLVSTLVDRKALPQGILKDLRTSTNYLATALGYAGPAACPVDCATQPLSTWLAALDAHFAALTAQGRVISASTRRNTRTNLRRILRAAGEQGLLTLPPKTPLLTPPRRYLFRLEQKATAPYQETYKPTHVARRFGLAQRDWPPEIAAGWQHYQDTCSDRIRPVTFRTYAGRLTTYLGYIVHEIGRTPTWDDCFDPALLRTFVRW